MTNISLKAEQRFSMEAVYNVFVRLPTDYEKSLCYQALPFIVAFKLGLVGSQKHSLVLVVSPLVALMVTSLYLTIRHRVRPSPSATSFGL